MNHSAFIQFNSAIEKVNDSNSRQNGRVGGGWETKVNGNFKPLLFLVSAIHSFLAESFSATSKHKHKNGNVMDERREEKEEDFPC